MFETLTRVYEHKAAHPAGSLMLRAVETEDVGGLTVVPVLKGQQSVFGAEIFGIDWDEPISTEMVQQVVFVASSNDFVSTDGISVARQAAR